MMPPSFTKINICLQNLIYGCVMRLVKVNESLIQIKSGFIISDPELMLLNLSIALLLSMVTLIGAATRVQSDQE